ncbi:MAG TPA: hypothetical protein VHE11_09360 [Steroidobacteraceae bacterium]|nr:hypothetical protein [Steroidobacteraceae bacterium]
MSRRIAMAFSMAVAAAGCSTVGHLTVKSYTASSGERVMAGQAAPEAGYGCEKLTQESRRWGLAGNMDRARATESLTADAVESAPAKGANYVYVMVPGSASIGGFNVNAFKDAQVAYYKCSNLPAATS